MTTVYLPGRVETVKAGQLSFVAGLALADTVSSLIGPEGAVSIKWPNDVLVGGAKISGILLNRALPRCTSGLGVCRYGAEPCPLS